MIHQADAIGAEIVWATGLGADRLKNPGVGTANRAGAGLVWSFAQANGIGAAADGTIAAAAGSSANAAIGSTVQPGPVPVVTGGPFVFTGFVGNDVLIGHLTVTNTPLTSIQIVSGDPNGFFAVYPATQNLRTAAAPAPQVTGGTYSLGITATNSAGTSSVDIVTVVIGSVAVANGTATALGIGQGPQNGIGLAAGTAVANGEATTQPGASAPIITNVDFALTAPVTLGQVVGSMTAVNGATSWTLVSDSSVLGYETTYGGTRSAPGGFFAIDNNGQITVTGNGVTSGTTAGYQTGNTFVVTVTASNAHGAAVFNGYATIGIPINANTGLPFVGPATTGFQNEPTFATATTQGTNGIARTPGTLRAWPGGGFTSGSVGTPTVYQFYDFNNGPNGLAINGSNITFRGCRFQGTNTSNETTNVTGTNLRFEYCTNGPLVSATPTPATPLGGMVGWPASAGNVGISIDSADSASWLCAHTNTSQFPWTINAGITNVVFTHCDTWGGGDLFSVHHPPETGTPGNLTVDSCWFHDHRQPGGDHMDGVGALDSNGAGPCDWTIKNCTIASPANTNAIAMQGAATGPWDNIIMDGNYVTGYGAAVNLSINPFATNCQFTDNIISTSIPWSVSFLYSDQTATFNNTKASCTGNLWRRNKFLVVPNVPRGPGPTWTTANNGQFILPNSSFSNTDFTG